MSRASKQVGTNVTKKLLSEMQALIAFACYDSPTIAQGGDSMTETTMAETMTALYFGGDDPEIISYLDQFINGLHRFAGLYTSSEPDEFGILVLTMPHKLHRHGGLNIFVGPTSISKELLSKKNFANKNEKIAGRTLLRNAKEVVTTCKKMMGLVTASGSPYRDGTFSSGTNWDDYIKWCLVTMQSDCDREAKAKLLNLVATTRDESATTTMMTDSSAGTVTMTESAVTISQVDNIGRDRLVEQQPLPPDDIASSQRSKSKYVIRTWHVNSERDEKGLDCCYNRRGKKRNADTVGMDTNSFVPPLADNVEDLALLTKTLEHLAAEAMEKEEKQHHHLRVRLVRDKLAARRRRSEVLLQRLTLSSKFKKKPDSTLFDKMNVNEEEIEKLEDELATLQELECIRHSEMMAN
ncbi:hypothetical protein MHU86_13690 [Fragilaria crotonensis]|nr:hypothetical protein MHU86_13690 [Fragilaria crotonensis]